MNTKTRSEENDSSLRMRCSHNDIEIVTVRGHSIGSPTPHASNVLFVHGGNHGAWCWLPMQEYVAQQYGVTSHAINLRGHGQSWGRAQLRRTTLDDFAADVLQVLDDLPDARTYVLVGHSMGAFVLLRYLQWRHPVWHSILAAST